VQNGHCSTHVTDWEVVGMMCGAGAGPPTKGGGQEGREASMRHHGAIDGMYPPCPALGLSKLTFTRRPERPTYRLSGAGTRVSGRLSGAREASLCHVMNLRVLKAQGGLYVPRYELNVHRAQGGLYVPRYELNLPRAREASMCHVMTLTYLGPREASMCHVMTFNLPRVQGGLYVPRYDINLLGAQGGLYVPRYDIKCARRPMEASMCHVMTLMSERGP